MTVSNKDAKASSAQIDSDTPPDKSCAAHLANFAGSEAQIEKAALNTQNGSELAREAARISGADQVEQTQDSRKFFGLFGSQNPDVRIWKCIAAVFAVIAVVQMAMQRFPSSRLVELSNGGAEIVHGAPIRVTFNPDASEATIRSLFLDLDLVIVDGPSALGQYTLVAENEDARALAMGTLLNTPSVITRAELTK